MFVRNWFRRNDPDIYDIAVCGSGLSAHIAAYSACNNGLSVLWMKPEPKSTLTLSEDNFDSLSAEGVSYLRGLMAPSQMKAINLGEFSSPHSNNQHSIFDKFLGSGLQLNTDKLKSILMENCRHDLALLNDSALDYQDTGQILQITGASEPVYSARWLINAQGEQSALSKQPPQYISDDLWISRNAAKPDELQRNSVSFIHDELGWQWQAFDNQGRLCITQWHRWPDASLDTSKLFNCRWYKRENMIESRDGNPPKTLLVTPTNFRFDPASGLGATLQIKSALLAVRAIIRELHEKPAISPIFQYQQQMQSTFREIAQSLSGFYQSYGVKITI